MVLFSESSCSSGRPTTNAKYTKYAVKMQPFLILHQEKRQFLNQWCQVLLGDLESNYSPMSRSSLFIGPVVPLVEREKNRLIKVSVSNWSCVYNTWGVLQQIIQTLSYRRRGHIGKLKMAPYGTPQFPQVIYWIENRTPQTLWQVMVCHLKSL